jgi:hypothetical protein
MVVVGWLVGWLVGWGEKERERETQRAARMNAGGSSCRGRRRKRLEHQHRLHVTLDRELRTLPSSAFLSRCLRATFQYLRFY